MGFNIWRDCKRVPITELLSFIVDNRGKTVPTAPSGHKLIATNCVTNDTLFPVYEKIRYLSEETYQTWFRAHPLPGDILFVNKGTPGRVCLVPDPVDFCIAQDMIALRVDDTKIYNKYLFAVLRSREIQQQIYNTNVGDVIPHFKKQFMNQLLIPVPEREIQETIGDLYYLLSFKIEHNKKINENLEKQAQALFKHWFVDFEFPNEEGKPYRSSGGKMVESEMGLIPEGWFVKNIGDVVKIVGGNTPSTANPEYWDGGIHPFCTPKDLASLRSPILLDTERHLTNSGVQKISSKQLPSGTLLLSSRAPIGYTAISAVPLSINQGFIALLCNENISNVYLLHWLQENMDDIKGRANGSTFLEISKSNFRSIPFIVPNETVLSAYNDIVKPYYHLIENATKESERLEEMRDILLPKLMNSEINVLAN